MSISKSPAFTKEKKNILFLHGYLSNKQVFAYQTNYFKKDFNVFSLDLKGFGENADMPYPYNLNDYCKDVLSYVEENEIEKPCVIAHSFGARIAVKLAVNNPNLFDKLVLTGAAGLKSRPTFKKVCKVLAFKFLKLFIPKKRLTRFYSKDYRELNPVMRQSFKNIIAEHLDSVVQYVSVPTLLIFGDRDRETPLYMGKRFNRLIPNSRLVVFKNAGHFPFIDFPFKFNAEVREFLLS